MHKGTRRFIDTVHLVSLYTRRIVAILLNRELQNVYFEAHLLAGAEFQPNVL
jgi:hypothetical protein